MKREKLVNSKSFEIRPSRPFNFEGTFNKPSHFPSALDLWEEGRYWQPMRVNKRLFGLRIENKGTTDRPRLSVTVFYGKRISFAELESIRREIAWRFDLNADLDEFGKLVRDDKRFAPVFRKWLGMRTSTSHDLYGLLMISVFLQNTTVRRTTQMANAMLERFGTRLTFDSRTVLAMWLPEDIERHSEGELRSLKVGYRAKLIKRISKDFAEGRINEPRLRELDFQDAKTELMQIYGVGPETARILLFEALHDYGTFDHISPWQDKVKKTSSINTIVSISS